MKSIFVSSTFRDMNFERDVINNKITPKINRLLSQYNQSIKIVDLRWGIDTSDMDEDQASNYVLSKCNEYIDKCKPYIIIILGDRYGWIPPNQEISVTHMEILRGVLENIDTNHIFVYFRNADYSLMPKEYWNTYNEQNDEYRNKLNSLKSFLYEKMPDRCKTYSASWSKENNCLISEDFASMIIEDLEIDLINDNIGTIYKSDLQKQLTENENTLKENLSFAYFDEIQIKNSIEKLTSSTKPFCIVSDGGTGKSVYLSLLCSTLREKNEANILFCGDNAFSSSVRNAAEALLYTVSTACGEIYDFENGANLSYTDILSQLLIQKSKIGKKIYFFLDAVEKCDHEMFYFIDWCNVKLNNKVVIILSSRKTEDINSRMGSYNLFTLSYNKIDYKRMADSILKGYLKEIPEEHIQKIIDKSDTPLQLKLNISMIANLESKDFDEIQTKGGDINAINNHIKQIIDSIPKQATEQIIFYLDKLIDDNTAFHELALMTLMHCPYGLFEDDLHIIFERFGIEWVELEYLDFLERFAFFIRTRDNGRLDISYDIVREALHEKFGIFGSGLEISVCNYFMDREPQDLFSIRSFFATVVHAHLPDFLFRFLQDKGDCMDHLCHDHDKMILGKEIRTCIIQLYIGNGRKLLMDAFDECFDDKLQYAKLHAALSMSLYSMHDDDYPKTIIKDAMYDIATLYWKNPFFQIINLSFEESIKENCIGRLSKYGKKTVEEFEQFWNSHLNNETERVCTKSEKLSMPRLYSDLREMDETCNTPNGAKKCIEALNNWLTVLYNRRLDQDEDKYIYSYADIYKKLIDTYLSLGELNKCEECCKYIISMYEREISNAPTIDQLRDGYNSALFNYAMIIENRAIFENDLSLLKEALPIYEAIYRNFSIDIAFGCSDKNFNILKSIVIHYGLCLCILGNVSDGAEKLSEGIEMIKNILFNNPSNHIKENIIIYKLIEKCIVKVFANVDEYTFHKRTESLCKYINNFVKNENESPELKLQLLNMIVAQIKDIIKQADVSNDTECQLRMKHLISEIKNALKN